MNTIIDADAAKLAGLQIDTLQKVRSGQITLGQWERFNNLSTDDREERFGDLKEPEAMVPGKRLAVESVQPTLFKASDTDLDYWLDQAEKFAKKHLGVEIDLRKRFAIPAELPWKSVIPIFDPGGLDNRGMVEKALEGLGLTVYEETDVMKYSGSEAYDAPTLHLIENSVRPNADTMGKSPNDLRQTGKTYQRLRGYGLAFALYHFATKEWLDPRTWTWFPEDRLSDGNVACGRWSPDNRQVRFRWDNPDNRYSYDGARVAMSVSLKT